MVMFRGLLLMLVTQVSYAAHPDLLLPFIGYDETWPTQQSIKQSPPIKPLLNKFVQLIKA